ncbi:MAG: hypothetical protein ACLQMT_03630 [Candidatus Acidiferrales bacterium]
MSYLACKVCGRGELIPKQIYRLSGPAVVIGYILLIPSVLGMVVCTLTLVAVAGYMAATNSFQVIGGAFAIFWGVAFFVGGLLGWLLVMKKRVLQCSVCGATVSAS